MDDRKTQLMAGHLSGTLTESEGQELVRLAATDETVQAALQLQETTHRLLQAHASTTSVDSILAALPQRPSSGRVPASLPRLVGSGNSRRFRWMSAAAAALMFVAICWWSQHSGMPAPGWVVAAREGQAQRHAGETRSPLDLDERIAIGESISLSANGTVRLRGDDGTVLDLSRSAGVSVVADTPQLRRLLVTSGEVHAVVAKQPSAARFVMETPQAEITVVGTRFSLTVIDRVTTVTVEEGTVAVKPVEGPIEHLIAGQRKRWPAEPVAVDAAAAAIDVVITAEADADADASLPSVSFGTEPGLHIRAGVQPRVALVRFTVPPGRIAQARLVLHQTTGDSVIQVHQQTTVGGWQEGDLRWYHVPGQGRLIGTLREQDGMWVCDIPRLQPGPCEFYLAASDGHGSFGSREMTRLEPTLRLRLAP